MGVVEEGLTGLRELVRLARAGSLRLRFKAVQRYPDNDLR